VGDGVPLWEQAKLAREVRAGCGGRAAAIVYGAWMALIAGFGLLGDYKYYFFANSYPSRRSSIGRWWHSGGRFTGFCGWITAWYLLAGAIGGGRGHCVADGWGRRTVARSVVWRVNSGPSLGYVLFMTLQNHPQPRYFAVPAFSVCFVVALGAGALAEQARWARRLGWIAVVVAVTAAGIHGWRTIGYATHPEYTFVNAATQLTQYIDTHPNGKRLMVSTSGDEITLITRLPAICDELSTEGWPTRWPVRAGMVRFMERSRSRALVDLHTRYSLEQ
jgi:hypothetical protein